MKHHVWDTGTCIYETVYGFVCRDCGARIVSDEVSPTSSDLKDSRLPENCDDAVIVVIHDDYASWSPDDCWLEDDIYRKPVWE